MSAHSSFCSFLWKDTLVDLQKCEVHSCCKTIGMKVSLEEINELGKDIFSNSSQVRLQRNAALRGLRPSSCEYCWKLEDAGLPSMRDSTESLENFCENESRSESELLDFPLATSIDTLEIVLGNSCQMKCLYCSEQFSSAWQLENSQVSASGESQNLELGIQEKFRSTFLDYLPEALETVSHIHFVGGEPLVQRDFYKYLNVIAEEVGKTNRSKLLQIDVISNLSIPDKLMDRFYSSIEQLPEEVKVNLLPSIENIGQQAEYVRYGLQWSLFERNLKRALNYQGFEEIKILSTFNLLALPGLEEFFEFLSKLPNSKKINLRLNPVNGRPEFLVENLGDEALPMLKGALNKIRKCSSEIKNTSEVERLLGQYIEGLDSKGVNRERVEGFLGYLEDIDKRRSHFFGDSFPEFKKLLTRLADEGLGP